MRQLILSTAAITLLAWCGYATQQTEKTPETVLTEACADAKAKLLRPRLRAEQAEEAFRNALAYCDDDERQAFLGVAWRELERHGRFDLAKEAAEAAELPDVAKRLGERAQAAAQRQATEEKYWVEQEQQERDATTRACARGKAMLTGGTYSNDAVGLAQQCDLAEYESLALEHWKRAEAAGALNAAYLLTRSIRLNQEADRIYAAQRAQLASRLRGVTVAIAMFLRDGSDAQCDEAMDSVRDVRDSIERVITEYGARIVGTNESPDVIVSTRMKSLWSHRCSFKSTADAQLSLRAKDVDLREVVHDHNISSSFDALRVLLDRFIDHRATTGVAKP